MWFFYYFEQYYLVNTYLKNNFDWKDKQEIEANLSYEDKLKEAMGKDEY